MSYLDVFSIRSEEEFNACAVGLFKYQYENNYVYHQFCRLTSFTGTDIPHYTKINFLPIELFKSNAIYCGNSAGNHIFTSSGTTGQTPSKHYVKDLGLYEISFLKGFEFFYGNPSDYCFLFLLPSYLEREGSSLVYMAKILIEKSNNPSSGFYLNNYLELKEKLIQQKNKREKTILFGVTYALLDLCESDIQLDENFIVIETGGMKGRRKEMIKDELHEVLKKKLRIKHVHSEYGMTELLSQAYSKSDGVFECPPWMRVIIRDPYSPGEFLPFGKTGAINIIDLANQDSCAFIATQDLGRIVGPGKFEVLGRMNDAELRGCNLMVD